MIALIPINESKCNFVLKNTKQSSLLIMNRFKLFYNYNSNTKKLAINIFSVMKKIKILVNYFDRQELATSLRLKKLFVQHVV
jgi:hypothetical protein